MRGVWETVPGRVDQLTAACVTHLLSERAAIGVEDPPRRDAPPPPAGAIDIRVLKRMGDAYFGPSPGPKSSGRRFGCNFPDSLSESNISSAFNMAWSMLKYL